LGDFGSAKDIEKSIAKTFTGTPGYISPEMIRKHFKGAELNIDEKTDIWYIYIIIKLKLITNYLKLIIFKFLGQQELLFMNLKN